MKLLLDTHTFLWFINNDPKLSQNARDFIEDAANQPYLSIVSAWEIAIKVNLGKLKLPQKPVDVFIEEQTALNKIVQLGISLKHVSVVEILPLYHRDPFDRLLIAQSIIENSPLVSGDKMLDAYNSLTRLW